VAGHRAVHEFDYSAEFHCDQKQPGSQLEDLAFLVLVAEAHMDALESRLVLGHVQGHHQALLAPLGGRHQVILVTLAQVDICANQLGVQPAGRLVFHGRVGPAIAQSYCRNSARRKRAFHPASQQQTLQSLYTTHFRNLFRLQLKISIMGLIRL